MNQRISLADLPPPRWPTPHPMAWGRQRRLGAGPGELRLEHTRLWSGLAGARPPSPRSRCAVVGGTLPPPANCHPSGARKVGPLSPRELARGLGADTDSAGGRGAGVASTNARAGQARQDPRGEGRLPALNCWLPPSPEERNPASVPAWAQCTCVRPGGGDLGRAFPTWPRGRKGQFIGRHLVSRSSGSQRKRR